MASDDIIRLVADWSGKPYLFRKIILTLFPSSKCAV
jgi:hypothetical protein